MTKGTEDFAAPAWQKAKGKPAFASGMDLRKWLEDATFPKVCIPEGRAELHHWIYEKAKRKYGLQPPGSITEVLEYPSDVTDVDTQILVSTMGGRGGGGDGATRRRSQARAPVQRSLRQSEDIEGGRQARDVQGA